MIKRIVMNPRRDATGADISIVWFRQDLRLADNPALNAASERGIVIPAFIWSPDSEGDWPPGGASKWWLHHSLEELSKRLEKLGAKLILRGGNPLDELKSLVRETGAKAVFWNRRYEPFAIEQEKDVAKYFQGAGIESESFNSHLLFEPWEIENKSGKPFRVFTPFWKTCLAAAQRIQKPVPQPAKIVSPKEWPPSLSLSDLKLSPQRDWANGFARVWEPGEAGAGKNLKRFLRDSISGYEDSRNRPDQMGTSRLSPHLHFGEISPRQIWDAARQHKSASAKKFLAEIGWREFSHHLLFHFPETPTRPLSAQFEKFAWQKNAAWLKAWRRGRTGYPIVDAGMRELWATGWMHNRVRMVAASFLVKDLLQPWQEGARWFWDTLVDADLANNTLGWQWVAGCGADAAPFFRIFNPVLQGEKFDPDADYTRSWIPEIAALPDKWIHQPWNAPKDVLSKAGVELGRNYPEPVVSHAIAREVALERYARIKNS